MSQKAAIWHSGSLRLRLCCRKRSKGGALSPTRQLLLPCEDEIVKNLVDFHSVGYHRILQNAVVTLVKIEADKAVLKIYSKQWQVL